MLCPDPHHVRATALAAAFPNAVAHSAREDSGTVVAQDAADEKGPLFIGAGCANTWKQGHLPRSVGTLVPLTQQIA
jgi:hypothetical protein